MAEKTGSGGKMTNMEWMLSLNKQQRRRRRKAGKIPPFAIYRIYNHVTKDWVGDDAALASTNLYYKFKRAVGRKAYCYRFSFDEYMRINPLTGVWEKAYPRRNFGGDFTNRLELIKRVERMYEKWCGEEHVE